MDHDIFPPASGTPEPAGPAAPHPGAEGDEHDRGLIVERLAWSPEERLDANASFVRFYLSVRPQGPLIDGE